MAKKSAGNKSAAIREALAANPDKGPKEISELLKAQGHKVSPTYISVVKSADKKKAGGGRVVVRRKLGRPARSGGAVGGMGPMQSALEFIQSCGGLEQAKAVLATVEQLRAVV